MQKKNARGRPVQIGGGGGMVGHRENLARGDDRARGRE